MALSPALTFKLKSHDTELAVW